MQAGYTVGILCIVGGVAATIIHSSLRSYLGLPKPALARRLDEMRTFTIGIAVTVFLLHLMTPDPLRPPQNGDDVEFGRAMRDPERLLAKLLARNEEIARTTEVVKFVCLIAGVLLLVQVRLLFYASEAIVAGAEQYEQTTSLSGVLASGDVVKLKGGGPAMTVVQVASLDADRTVLCEWVDEAGTRHKAELSALILDRVYYPRRMGNTAQHAS